MLERIVIEKGFVEECKSGGGKNVVKAGGRRWEVRVKRGRRTSE